MISLNLKMHYQVRELMRDEMYIKWRLQYASGSGRSGHDYRR